MKEHRLQEIEGLTPEQLGALGALWIETVEQLLGASASTRGFAAVGRLLELAPPELGLLLARLEAGLDTSDREGLRQPVPGGGLGLVLPSSSDGAREMDLPRKESAA